MCIRDRLYGYTTYKISFDYKVVGEIAEDTEYFLAYYSTQSKTQRDAIYFKPESSPNSEVRHAEITFEPVADNETVFTMLIGCKKAPGTVIIDNMKIEQIRPVSYTHLECFPEHRLVYKRVGCSEHTARELSGNSGGSGRIFRNKVG